MTALDAESARPELTWSYAGEDPQLASASAASDREYGTFEVSVIDLEEATETPARKLSADSTRSGRDSCAGDCALLLRVLLAPVRLETCKCAAFHVGNFLFAVLAAALSVLLLAAKALARWSPAWSDRLRRVEADALRGLLRVDCGLFNFISADKDSVAVYNSPLGFQQEVEFFGLYAQAYFVGVKLLCAGVPGVVSAAMFLWAWLRVALLGLGAALGAPYGPERPEAAAHALSDTHALELEATALVMALYSCVLLLQVFAYVSRSVTMFFCSEFLVYAPP